MDVEAQNKMQERARQRLCNLGVPFSVAAGFFNRELPEDGEERLDGQEGIQVWMNSQNPFSGQDFRAKTPRQTGDGRGDFLLFIIDVLMKVGARVQADCVHAVAAEQKDIPGAGFVFLAVDEIGRNPLLKDGEFPFFVEMRGTRAGVLNRHRFPFGLESSQFLFVHEGNDKLKNDTFKGMGCAIYSIASKK